MTRITRTGKKLNDDSFVLQPGVLAKDDEQAEPEAAGPESIVNPGEAG
jgi:hypothetical protein